MECPIPRTTGAETGAKLSLSAPSRSFLRMWRSAASHTFAAHPLVMSSAAVSLRLSPVPGMSMAAKIQPLEACQRDWEPATGPGRLSV